MPFDGKLTTSPRADVEFALARVLTRKRTKHERTHVEPMAAVLAEQLYEALLAEGFLLFRHEGSPGHSAIGHGWRMPPAADAGVNRSRVFTLAFERQQQLGFSRAVDAETVEDAIADAAVLATREADAECVYLLDDTGREIWPRILSGRAAPRSDE